MWNNEKAGLHPLLTAAAVSLTVFSAVGIGAITGLLPTSLGSARDTAPEVVATQAASTAPVRIEDASLKSVAPSPSPALEMPPAAPKATPAAASRQTARPKVVKKIVTAQAPAGAPAPAVEAVKPVVEAPKPVPAGILGVVESVREVKQKADKSNGVGPIAGGIAGAVLGSTIGKGDSGGMRKVLTVLGAAGGALAGKEIERNVRATSHWEIAVRLDDGSHRTLTSEAQPFWTAGDRVRFLDGRLQPV
jgi:outer membrane lipoprotein SlyB